jgi:hypothetical protein
MTKYKIIERPDGLFQPLQNKGGKWLFPVFESLHDAHIYMEAVRSDYKTGIVGNVSIERVIK